MSSSFVYQPHVRQSDGTVITPDILIERVYVSRTDGTLAPAPVSRLTSATAIQQSADAPVGAPAVVLIAASYGLLVSVGVILEDFLPVARAAWRYDDIADGYDGIALRSWTLQDGRKVPFVAEKLSALMSPSEAMAALGNPAGLRAGTAVFIGHPAPLGESIAAERFELALESAGRNLTYTIGIETLA